MSRTIKAAVVEAGQPPIIKEITLPAPAEGQAQVRILASGLSHLVRSKATGRHYSAKGGAAQVIPGVDGVCELPTGEKAVFVTFLDRANTNSYAQYANINTKDLGKIPASSTTDVATIAALCNPLMSSFYALKHRVASLKPGFSILILGVTGTAGQIAAQMSRHLGAKTVIGAGRNESVLNKLKSAGTIDSFVVLTSDDAALKESFSTNAAHVDVVLDYLWGHPAEIAMVGIFQSSRDSEQHLDWVQIGSLAGQTLNLHSALLRGNNFSLVGSGIGGVTMEQFRGSFPEFVTLLSSGKFSYPVKAHSFDEVTKVWQESEDSSTRHVFVW